MSFKKELSRRRTFAIIAHPDAGKTTLTEKLLLFGGAIQTAGAVKSNKIKKGATSDFMEIERQRRCRSISKFCINARTTVRRYPLRQGTTERNAADPLYFLPLAYIKHHTLFGQ